MKFYGLLFGFLYILLTSCDDGKEVYFFSSFHEPATDGLRMLYSFDGYEWEEIDSILLKPEVGKKIMRDPSIVQGPDGIFHLVWTCAWQGGPGFGYSSSPDLIHWSEQKLIPVMKDTSTVNIWAPELFYDELEERFIIIWASTIPFKFPRGIEDERNNHRMYYTTTGDFSTFSDTELFLDPGFSVIDAVILKRGKEDYVLVLKDNTRPERNLKVSFSANPLGPWSQPSEAFTAKFTEGPTILKKDDYYLIYYDAYRDKNYKAVRTKDFINFKDISDEIDIPEGHKHGTIFTTEKRILDKLINKD